MTACKYIYILKYIETRTYINMNAYFTTHNIQMNFGKNTCVNIELKYTCTVTNTWWYMYIYIRMEKYIYIYLYICIYIYIYLYMHEHIYKYTFRCTLIQSHVYQYMILHISIWTSTYIQIYTWPCKCCCIQTYTKLMFLHNVCHRWAHIHICVYANVFIFVNIQMCVCPRKP